MGYFDEAEERFQQEAEMIFWALSRVHDHFGRPPRVVMSNTIRPHYAGSHILTLPELYLIFIRALTSNLSKPIKWDEAKPIRLVNSTSARNLITHIFHSRND
jgi:hypothetical protein